MSQKDRVIVVGAGPVGILTALGLARAGVEVVLLERDPDLASAPRAMVYHWTVLAGLAELGLLDAAERAGFTKQDYAFSIRPTGELIHYSMAVLDGHTPYPYNVHLGQDRLTRLGLAALENHAGVEIRFGWELGAVRQYDARVTAVRTDGEEVTGAWLVGADGAGSAVRKALNLGFDGITWDERFVATDIRYDFAALGFARTTMVVDPRFGAIVAQAEAGEPGLWRYTFSEDRSLPEEGVTERAGLRLRAALPGGETATVERLSPYRMHQRSAPTMRAGRVLLAGDAGHATNPTGGLGLTSGLFDLYSLYPALAAVVRGRVPESVLDRWSAERLRVFREIASPAATENKRFVYNSDDPRRLADDVDRLRRTLADPAALLARLRFTESLVSPIPAATS